MIIKDAARGCTTDELAYFNNNFTYTVTINITQEVLKPHLERFKQACEHIYYPVCINTLRNYLKQRQNAVNRKAKPRVRFIQKANSYSGRSRLSCLATGFYPRHINLTLYRDGQLVADHEITGGDLLPNDDGTYQMRKSLEISAADKHNYTCSATHLSLDYKLDVTLEFYSGEPFKSVILSVLIVLVLMLAFGTGAIIYKCRKRQTASSKSDYSASTSSHSLLVLLTYIKEETAFPVYSATIMLDDITVGYYNLETKIYNPKGNTTNEDDLVDPNHQSPKYNDDGTYQMRKSLKISAEDKHKYTCSVTHLSLDNKLDVTLGIEV
ncbi:H-2 class I histocompatibility antigen, D-B alpha chain-like [Garra rufa]|uniref:H-2 class I histocompatibility antigen, D-B alpha chain-like n=1 Tax=Garra rufa TaxID=137080 RepID=UPI003CCE55B9